MNSVEKVITLTLDTISEEIVAYAQSKEQGIVDAKESRTSCLDNFKTSGLPRRFEPFNNKNLTLDDKLVIVNEFLCRIMYAFSTPKEGYIIKRLNRDQYWEIEPTAPDTMQDLIIWEPTSNRFRPYKLDSVPKCFCVYRDNKVTMFLSRGLKTLVVCSSTMRNVSENS